MTSMQSQAMPSSKKKEETLACVSPEPAMISGIESELLHQTIFDSLNEQQLKKALSLGPKQNLPKHIKSIPKVMAPCVHGTVNSFE